MCLLMNKIQYFVPGLPVPQGDLNASRTGHLYHKNKALAPWRHEVQWRARKALRQTKDGGLWVGPITITLRFVLKRPVGTPKRRETPPAIKRPDLDKLTRAVFDALTEVVYQDDSQIIEDHCYKRTAEIDEQTGVSILVTTNINRSAMKGLQPNG